MPNWCENDLTITGPAEQVEELAHHVGLQNDPPQFDFDTLIPYPAEFRRMDEEVGKLTWEQCREQNVRDGFNSGGYEWCIQNWGTKWQANDLRDIVEIPGAISLTFDTAWSPPEPVITALAEAFPALVIVHEYFECGCCYAGRNTYKGGEQTESHYDNDYSGERGG